MDHARRHSAAKRGGAVVPLSLDEAAIQVASGNVDLETLDDALGRLAELDQQQARVVELRYFTGLGIEETAQALGISPATLKREWAMARAWLKRELSAD